VLLCARARDIAAERGGRSLPRWNRFDQLFIVWIFIVWTPSVLLSCAPS
jgi:hypothetical protein